MYVTNLTLILPGLILCQIDKVVGNFIQEIVSWDYKDDQVI